MYDISGRLITKGDAYGEIPLTLAKGIYQVILTQGENFDVMKVFVSE